MVHLWRPRAKEDFDVNKSAPGVGVTGGDIAVIIEGKALDMELVRLAGQMAKRARRRVHLVYVIEVPRTLPLKAVMTKESEVADKLLREALKIGEETGFDAVAELVQARDAGPAIVDEAKDHNCALLLIGLVRDTNKVHNDLGRTIPYVLEHAPCRVWVVQDPSRNENKKE